MLDIKINNHFYNYILDIVDTNTYKLKQITPKKTHKRTCIIKFDNEVLAIIRLSKIFNLSDIIKTLPYNLQKKDSIIIVTLGNTIRNNILNYKDVVNPIYKKLKFCNLHNKNIITGDLEIIGNKKLKKAFNQGSKIQES